jgi:hypothetical protein
MLERDIEKYLIRRTAERGGVAYKWVSPGRVGVADRIVVLPGGVVWFVEVKTVTGRLSEMQKIFAADMMRLKQNYRCVWCKEDVDELLQ